MRRIHWYGPTVVLLVTTLLVMVAGPSVARKIAWASADARIALVKDRLAGNPSLADLSESFREVAEVVAPSVVHIQVSSKANPVRRRSFDEDELLRRWRFFDPDSQKWVEPFENHGPFRKKDFKDDEQDEDVHRYNVPRQSGSGSGWVYDHLGHIITNYHVIEDADVISVRFQDGSEHEGTVIGADPKTDIAVIQVDTDNLHPSSIADQPVEQGDIVFAFGSPFQFEFSMSQGIVSGKGRRLHILDRHQGYENFIQTDASINPGNSGGPLTNIYGQVVGMNTAIATRTGVYNGLGFAIPVSMVTNVVDQLIETGRVTRGYLGIFIADLDPKLAQTFGFDGDGVLVENPIEDGPAEEVGIQRGDIITRINGELITQAEELRRKVASYPPGTELDLEIFRDGEHRTLEVTLGELPDRVTASRGSVRTPSDRDPDKESMRILRRLGFDSLMTSTQETARRLDTDYHPGVLVRSIRPHSAAAAAGIESHDVITHVMNDRIDSVEAFITALDEHDLSEGVRLSILHRGMPRFVFLELPKD